MLKTILNLNGAQQLSKSAQKTIIGGHNCTGPAAECWVECQYTCLGKKVNGVCVCP